MMKNILFQAVLALIAINAQATNITGKVNKNTSNSNAAVALFDAKDSALLKSVLTDNNGDWMMTDVSAGNYFLYTSADGFITDSSNVFTVADAPIVMPAITLKLAPKKTNKIDGVSVVAKKPMIEVKADKTIINVESSINAAGSNALEILRKSPGVTIDKDDNISLKGKSGVMVYIDGKQTYLDNATIASILKGTQSTAIESIELITNPSAKYDAAGNAGIINIKLKKNKRIGTNGTVTGGISYGYTPKYNGSININHNNKKINVFGMYSADNGKNENFFNFYRTQGGFNYDQKNIQISSTTDQTFKVGADYMLSTKHILGAVITGNVSNGSWASNSNTFINPATKPVDRILEASNNSPLNSKNINTNINYKFADTNGTTFNIDLDYGNFSNRASSYQPNTYKNINGSILQQLLFKNQTPVDINIYTAKTDYEKTIGKGKLGLGLKTSFVKTNNVFNFYDVIANVDTLNLDRSNIFNYTENVNAAYANYNTTLSKKWTLQSGLRLEQTNSNGVLTSQKPGNNNTVPRTYTNLFPSAAVSYAHNDMHNFGLSFSRRIQRPNYQDLNPFENKIDELTYQKGNAFLRPQYAYSTDFTYTLMQAVNIGLNHTYTKDVYSEITDTALGARAFITNKNLANNNQFGLSIGSPVPIKKWWFAFININATYTMVKANFNNNIIDIKYPNMNLYAENNFTLPKNFSASISGWYSTAGYWGGTFKTSPLGNIDLGIQKLFLQKKLTAKLAFTDIFWSTRWHGVSDFAGLKLDARGGNESRQIRLTISYRFGSTTIQAARERQTGLSEEANRIKKGK
jgi:iron complex outermembrane recepter protein